jgi:regulatory protein YycI of two-component signal transduction system YycFG
VGGLLYAQEKKKKKKRRNVVSSNFGRSCSHAKPSSERALPTWKKKLKMKSEKKI